MPGLYIMEQVHGWIPEWPKGTDCKSAGDAFEGSNPSPSTTYLPNIVREIFLSNTKSFHHIEKALEHIAIHSRVLSPLCFLS